MLTGQGQLPVTDVVNGQLIPVSPAYAINPAAFGPAPISFDMYAAQPTVPPYAGTPAPGMSAYGTGGGTDTANVTAAAAAESNPFNLRLSPLLWSLIFLVVGLAGLRLVHW